MAGEIVLTADQIQKLSGRMKTLAEWTKAFNKDTDKLTISLRALNEAPKNMLKQSSNLEKAITRADKAAEKAQKSYKALRTETGRGAMDEAVQEQERLRQALKETEEAIQNNRTAQRKLAEESGGTGSGGQSGAGGGTSLFQQLQKAGVFKPMSEAAGQAATALLTSALGESMGRTAGGALAGAASGAIAGSAAGAQGAVIGAFFGLLSGGISGITQNFQDEDEVFKTYYKGLYEAGKTAAQENLTSGSATAAQRELEGITLDELLGAEAGASAADRQWMAETIARIEQTNQIQTGDLEGFQARGADVLGMLAKAYGVDAGQMQAMLSEGEVGGRDAASVLYTALTDPEGPYTKALEMVEQTFSGLTSALEDTMENVNAGYGEGYNPERSKGLQAEIDAYGGALGTAMENLNRISGENAAYMENLQDRYTREALSAVLLGEDTSGIFDAEQREQLEDLRAQFIEASAQYEQGSQEGGLKMEDLRDQAAALATMAYENSDAYQTMHETELDQLDSLRQLTSTMETWYDQYELQQEQTKGQGRGVLDNVFLSLEEQGGSLAASRGFAYGPWATANAYGLRRVPYDGYAAILHEGERVLTAREARAMDRGGPGGVTVNVTGSWSVRSGADVDALAEALYRRIRTAQMGGVRT